MNTRPRQKIKQMIKNNMFAKMNNFELTNWICKMEYHVNKRVIKSIINNSRKTLN